LKKARIKVEELDSLYTELQDFQPKQSTNNFVSDYPWGFLTKVERQTSVQPHSHNAAFGSCWLTAAVKY